MVQKNILKYSKLLSVNVIKLLILVFTLLFITSIIYAQTCQQEDDNCLSEEDFVSDPRNAFRNSPNEAWTYIMQNPLATYNGINGESIIRESYRSSRENFVNVVTQNTQLFENPVVRELFEQEVDRDINILNQNPSARRDFLRQYGIQDISTPLQDFNRRRGEITTVGSDGQQRVTIPLSIMNGGRVNSDGSVTLANDVRIYSGQVDMRGNELRLRRGGTLIAPSYDGIISSDRLIGLTQNLDLNSFEISGRNIELRDSNNVLVNRITGTYTLFPNNQAVLGGRSRIEYLNSQGQVLERVDVSQNTLFLSNRACPDNSQMSCIYRSGDSIVVNPIGNNRINYEIFSTQYSQFDVSLIRDSSNVRIRVPNDEGRQVTFDLNQRGLRQSGLLGSNSNFNLAYEQISVGPNGESRIVSISDYRINNGRYYSIHTGVERPNFEASARCEINQNCRIGSQTFTRNQFEVFCRNNDGHCFNEYGIRVSSDGRHYISGNPPQIVGSTSQSTSRLYMEDLEFARTEGWISSQETGFRTRTQGASTNTRNSDIPVVRSGALVYPDMRAYRCAEHSRRSAADLYGINFIPGNAWDFAGNNAISASFTDSGNRRASAISTQERTSFETQTVNAINSGQMNPGDVVTVWNPRSNYARHDTTHTLLFRGVNQQGQPIFDHQWGSRFEQITMDEVLNRNLRPRAVVRGQRTA
ncbi:MAG: hypothetical protein LAT82_00390 [Nanoarchaeota archaeon]|nr:hypothetical protein [Nanoarchaeota archaeon]